MSKIEFVLEQAKLPLIDKIFFCLLEEKEKYV